MILKILPRHNPGAIKGLLAYIQNHAKSKDGKVHQILHNVRSKDVAGQAREFYKNEAYRKVIRKNTVYVRHEILSFSPNSKEELSNVVLEDIAREYIRLRGTKAMVVAAVHNQGKENYHIHLCVSGAELISGKSTDLPKQELFRVKTELQSYYLQKYKFLAPSAVRHGLGKGYLNQKEYQLKIRTDRKLKKEEIAETVRACFEQSKTQNEFLDKLREANLPHYERKGIAQGIVIDGMKFRFSRMDLAIKDLHFDRTSDEIALEEIKEAREQVRKYRQRDLVPDRSI